MRIAIVHEWLVNYAGSERVLEQLLKLYPDAAVFSVVDYLSAEDRLQILGGRPSTPTFIQKLPGARKHFRTYLPLMPLAVEQHDLSSFDIVISSSHAVAKGVLTGPNQLHISYLHSPVRYAWDLQHQYLAEAKLAAGPKSWAAKLMLHYVRLWDARTAHGVDHFIANSEFVSRRIEKVYRRKAAVIYPPVATEQFQVVSDKADYYLTASRCVPYKRVPLIAEAFSRMPERKLVVIGDGPELERVRAVAGPNVLVLGYQPPDVLKHHMQRAKAFVFAAEEDFGIVPVEAQACGTPVIAYARGGALETVRGLGASGRPTGVFFERQDCASIVAAVRRFEANADNFSPEECARNAERFSSGRFASEFREYIEASVAAAAYLGDRERTQAESRSRPRIDFAAAARGGWDR